jgi:hypothetical protein
MHLRIYDGVEDIREEIPQDNRYCQYESDPLHDGKIAHVDRGHEQPANAGSEKDNLDYNGSANQPAYPQAQQRDNGDQCISKSVFRDHSPVTESLCFSG